MTRVLLLASDNGGCAFYRLRAPAAASTLDVRVEMNLTVGRDMYGQIRDVVADADTVVFQRPGQAWQLPAIIFLQRRGVKVIVDMDDDFTCLHPLNPVFGEFEAHRRMAQACRQADLVTVTTPALARRYAPHGRVAVIPNYMPKAYLDIGGDKPHTVGWSGSIDTHHGDLDVTRGALAHLPAFHVVGTGKGVREALGLRCEPTTTGWQPLEDYPHRLAELQVGIVPLADTAFNHAKSALKMSEFSAVGAVPVVSPTPDNLRLHGEGVGLVAWKPRDWKRHVDRLLTDHPYRDDLAAKAREVMARNTVEANVWRWDEAWSGAQ